METLNDIWIVTRASDLHSARATILNTFYNMDYKIIKETGQNKTWIETDTPCKNVTPNPYNALAPAIVCVSNDVGIPFHSMASHLQHKEPYCKRTWIMGPKSFWNLQIGGWTQLYFFVNED